MLDTNRLCLGCMNDNGGEKICSICGYDSNAKNPENCIPAGSWLKERYLIGRAVEKNGEGITYIGWDNREDAIINIKEYFPDGSAIRNSDSTVSIIPGHEFAFNEGIMNFLELQRKLMALRDLPSLLPVCEVFEDGGSAYSIQKTVQGAVPLREFLIRNGGNLSWEQARPLFLPLITTISGLHDAGIIHRGISPETVIVGRDGKLRITGICIRPVRMSRSNLSVQLFPGFSAIEQYGYDIERRDGRYTDVYGVAATLFRVLMGTAPTAADERLTNDNMQIPAKFAETLPKYVLTALANALKLMPENRTQDIESFRISLTPVAGETNVMPVITKPSSNNTAVHTEPEEENEIIGNKDTAKKYAITASLITAGIFLVIGLIVFTVLNGGLFKSKKTQDDNSENSGVSSPVSSQTNESTTSNVSTNKKLIQVPDLVGKSYADVLSDSNYTSDFEFTVVSKKFSDKYAKGVIMEQKLTSDQAVKKGTEIGVVISLGSQKVNVPNVIGMNRNEAIIELLKQGFLYDNIKFSHSYDSSRKPNAALDVYPSVGTSVETDIRITVTFNDYDGTPVTSDDTSAETSGIPQDGNE